MLKSFARDLKAAGDRLIYDEWTVIALIERAAALVHPTHRKRMQLLRQLSSVLEAGMAGMLDSMEDMRNVVYSSRTSKEERAYRLKQCTDELKVRMQQLRRLSNPTLELLLSSNLGPQPIATLLGRFNKDEYGLNNALVCVALVPNEDKRGHGWSTFIDATNLALSHRWIKSHRLDDLSSLQDEQRPGMSAVISFLMHLANPTKVSNNIVEFLFSHPESLEGVQEYYREYGFNDDHASDIEHLKMYLSGTSALRVGGL